jgi:hypothetical protein
MTSIQKFYVHRKSQIEEIYKELKENKTLNRKERLNVIGIEFGISPHTVESIMGRESYSTSRGTTNSSKNKVKNK